MPRLKKHYLIATCLLADFAKGGRQNAISRCFRTKRVTGDHEAMPHNHHLVDLLNLGNEEVGVLEIQLLANVLGSRVEDRIVRIGILNTREEI